MSVVLITGASGAIGGACAREFAARGDNVVLHYYRNRTAAMDLESELNIKRPMTARALYADLTKENEAEALFAAAYDVFPALDALVCCAGTAYYGLISQTAAADWDRVMAVNVKSIFLCCRLALKYMARARKGRIVTLSSVWGITGAANEALYSASKGAVIAFSKALAKEAAGVGVSVNCVAPGAIESDMLSCFSESELGELRESIPLGKIGEPRDAARAVCFMASAAADYMTGQVLSPNGGLLI